MVFALGCQDITSPEDITPPEVESPNLSHGEWVEEVECWGYEVVDEAGGLAVIVTTCASSDVWVPGYHEPADSNPWDDEDGGGNGDGEGGDDGGPTDEDEEGCLLIGVTLQPDGVRPGAQTTVVVEISSTGAAPWVSFWATEVANSGGHSHTGRPLGQFGTRGGGVLRTPYTASAFGGAETIHVEACDKTVSAGLTVAVPWLRRLGAGTGYTLGGGANTPHSANHYGTAAANNALRNMGTWYHTQYPGSRLYYNDQSLPRGGWFDLNGAWTGAHQRHREGRNTDIQRTGGVGVPENRRPAVENKLRLEFTAGVAVHGGGSHWHVSRD